MNIKNKMDYYFDLTKASFKPATLTGHKIYINNLLKACEYLKLYNLQDIDLEAGYIIQAYLKSNTGNGNNSINKHMRYLKRVLNHYQVYTTILELKNLKSDTVPFKRFYHKELKLIIDYVKKMDYSANSLVYRCFVLLALDSGVRLSEGLNIKIRNINFDKMRIYLEITKTGNVRYAPISEFSLNEIKELIKRDPEREYLFYNFLRNRQLSKNDIKLFYRRLKKKLHIDKVHTHRFRKTFGSMLAENGLPIEHLQKIFDHSRITTTIKYVQYRETKSLEEYHKYVDWKL